MNTSPKALYNIKNLDSGLSILSNIPVSNAPQAEHELSHFLDSLHAAPPESPIFFQLLEQTRPLIADVADELIKRYANKALPLADAEELFFQKTLTLWQKMSAAYQSCAENDAPEAADYAQRLVIALHRCIFCSAQIAIVHQRAHRQYPKGLWTDLHTHYKNAETWNVATLTIPDGLSPNGQSHCAETYISALLGEMANCYGLSAADQRLVHRWSSEWAASLVQLHQVLPGETLSQYVIDLSQDVPLRLASGDLPGEHLRRLNTDQLEKQLKETRKELQNMVPPADLNLGSDCTIGQCRSLINTLRRPWSQARAIRKFPRHAELGSQVKLCPSFAGMHFYIAGKEFKQPENLRVYSRSEVDRLATFRHQLDPQQALQVHNEHLNYATETWTIVDQSVTGLRLARSRFGDKIAHNQLLAICMGAGQNAKYFLAKTTWQRQENDGGLVSGVAVFPGLPEAIAARALNANGQVEGVYQPVFLLPAISAIKLEETLVIPNGWYRGGKILELFTTKNWRVQLHELIDSGPNFEQVSFLRC